MTSKWKLQGLDMFQGLVLGRFQEDGGTKPVFIQCPQQGDPAQGPVSRDTGTLTCSKTFKYHLSFLRFLDFRIVNEEARNQIHNHTQKRAHVLFDSPRRCFHPQNIFIPKNTYHLTLHQPLRTQLSHSSNSHRNIPSSFCSGTSHKHTLDSQCPASFSTHWTLRKASLHFNCQQHRNVPIYL